MPLPIASMKELSPTDDLSHTNVNNNRSPAERRLLGKIVKVTSPLDHDVTNGHLCIKGRFGWEFVNSRPENSAGQEG